MTPTLVLDPSEVTSNRIGLDLNSGAIRVNQDGVDWGDAAISAFMADQRWGSTPVDYRVPNRQISIPLFLMDVAGGTTEETARQQLQQKVGLIQREGGALKRTAANGDVTYADIVNATLTLPDVWGDAQGVEANVKLVLEALPDFYGDEINLGKVAGAGVLSGAIGNTFNWYPNPSFEMNFPFTFTATNSTSVTQSAAFGCVSGIYAAFVVANGGGALTCSRTVASNDADAWVKAGTTYTFSAYMRSRTTTRTFYINVNWYKADGSVLSNTSGSNVALSNSSWTRLTYSVAAPATAVKAVMRLVSTTTPVNGEGHLVDAIMITETPAAVAFDDSTAVVKGDYPGRARVVITNTSAVNQQGLLWGLRHTDQGYWAKLAYEAENLTLVNGATSAAVSGASGDNVAKFTSLPAGVWVSFVATPAGLGTSMNHTGSYRVWGRFQGAATDVQYRLQWGIGSLSVPTVNDPVTISAGSNFYLADLGEIRIDKLPNDFPKWYGVLQAYNAPGGANALCDCLYFQPLDDCAGKLVYTNVPPASSISTSAISGTVANDAAVGTKDWGVAGGAASLTAGVSAIGDIHYDQCTINVGETSKYLKSTNFGFAVPASATIKGIQADVYYGFEQAADCVFTPTTRLSKAGTMTAGAANAAYTSVPISLPPMPRQTRHDTFGGPTDLWGGTWGSGTAGVPIYSDINNSGFGFGFSIVVGGAQYGLPDVDYISMTIYYTLAAGFTVASDSVIYAGQTAELNTKGMTRTPDGFVSGRQSQVYGDLPRIPVSGLEGQAVELFARPTEGDFGVLPDSGLDTCTAQVYYRPCWLSRS